MKKREPVSHIMTTEILTVQRTDTLREVKRIFENQAIRHLPVLEGETIVGIISKADLIRLNYGELFGNQDDSSLLDMLSIAQIMTDKPKVISPETTIREAADVFLHEEFHALPVVLDGKPVGIVTTTDVIRFLADQY